VKSVIALLTATAAAAAGAAHAQGPVPIGHDAAACAATAGEPAIMVLPIGLKDRKGQLRLEIYPDNDNDFLQDDGVLIRAGKVFRRVDVPTPQAGPIALCIRLPRPGRYTLMLLHDRDNNRKFGLTTDGVGFPGNPKLGWGRPKASAAFISVGAGVTVTRIILNYWRGFGMGPLRHAGD
jgi:uncharacterized protein (DUF2141 family)